MLIFLVGIILSKGITKYGILEMFCFYVGQSSGCIYLLKIPDSSPSNFYKWPFPKIYVDKGYQHGVCLCLSTLSLRL